MQYYIFVNGLTCMFVCIIAGSKVIKQGSLAVKKNQWYMLSLNVQVRQ